MWWNKQKAQAEGVKTLISPMIISLEPRMMFDGAAVATVAEADAAQPAQTNVDAAQASSITAERGTQDQTDAGLAVSAVAVPGQSVVFVDSRVKDAASLLQGVAPGTQVVVLEAGKDGLQQIADYLDSQHGVSTLEIIAHGDSANLWLGSTFLSADNIQQYSSVLAEIGNDMNVGGDILIYACNTALGDDGLSFVGSLAQHTGRDVAASSNRTGVGGDWNLEIATGSIESLGSLSAEAMAAYQYSLATVTVTNSNDSGAGSLREALLTANAEDTITFSGNMTVNLTSQLILTKNLTIDGDWNDDNIADVTLDGQYQTQVLRVNSGVVATLDGLVITKGLAAGRGADAGADGTASMGGGIVNAGNLTLNNVTVTANAASGGGGGGGVANGNVGGGGGGGGALGGQIGGRGGDAGTYLGLNGAANKGGNGGGYDPAYMGGHGAIVATGGSKGGTGAIGGSGYSNGGAGGTASSGSISIGGGGGGSGWNAVGGGGGSASGGIYNASTGTLRIIGNSVISNNIAAGGGGGGGGGANVGGPNNSTIDPGGVAGKGVGAIWNKGTLFITAANLTALNTGNNVGGSGSGGSGRGGTGAAPLAENAIFNDGGTINPGPTATIVVSDTALRVGETSLVTITFSEAVTGFTNADLTVTNGTLSAVSSSDGGITWTATLTPTSNVTDSTNVITLDNTGFTNGAGVSGTGTTSSSNYTIDTTRPVATIVVSDTTLSLGETAQVTFTFSEAVSGFGVADITVQNGTLSTPTTSNNIVWTATFTPVGGIADSTNVITVDNTGVTDASGNVGAGISSSNNYVIDTLRPTASITMSDVALSVGETSVVTITFSEAVTGFTNADLTIPNGTLSAVSSSDGGITWTATYTPNANVSDSTNLITLSNAGVTDLAGNAGTGITNSPNFTIDTMQPTATIVVSDTALRVGETSLVTITFSQAVSGFDNSDLSVANATLSAVSSNDGGITWTATLTPTDNLTDTSNVITLDNTGFVNASNVSGSGTTSSNNYAIDTQRPTATIVVADNALALGETSLVTITFSEAVTDFTLADMSVSNGTLNSLSSSDGGVTWTAIFTPAANITDSTNVLTLANTGVTDLAGNAGMGTTDSNNYAIDTVRPTATITMADTALSVGETSLVTITFSEAVTGFTNADLTIPNGTLSGVSSSDGGITWTATYTPDINVSDTSNLIILDNTGVTDLAGNTGTGTTNSPNFTIDTLQPTATIVVSDTALRIGETSLVTITFSEAVTGLTNADLTVANGTLSAVSSSDGGITWTATLTPTASVTDATNLITLDNTGFFNGSGNSGSGTTVSNNYAIDTERPTATIVVADNALALGETSLVTITFSEAVTGFSLADITASNGTLNSLSSSDGGVTWTAIFTPAANITDTTNIISLANTGVSDTAGNAGTGNTDSNNFAIDTVRPTATITMADTALSVGETSLVTITFSEAVTGFTNADLTIPNGSLSAVISSDGGITWAAIYTPDINVSDATNLITLNNSGVTDLAGNTGTGTTDSVNFTINTIQPTATVVVADSTLAGGETTLVTITFSEAVTGFDNSDLSVANGTLSAVSSMDGGITWTATLTPNANIEDTTNVITLDSSGVIGVASGNAGTTVSTSNNYVVDTAAPTASFSFADSTLDVNETTVVTITFSEPVSGFSNANLTVGNGTLSQVSSVDGGVTWTATFTPTSGVSAQNNVISLDLTGVADQAGNVASGVTVSGNYSIGTPPVVTPPVEPPVVTPPVEPPVVTPPVVQPPVVTAPVVEPPTPPVVQPPIVVTPVPSVVDAPNIDQQSPVTSNTTTVVGSANQVLQPSVFAPPTGNLASPLSFAPLFEQRTSGDGLPPVGNIFISNGALAKGFVAQVFNSDSAQAQAGGFLGFSGGEGGIFGGSTLASLFSRDTSDNNSSGNAFDSTGTLGGEPQDIRVGALTLGQQLEKIKAGERKQVLDLARALGDIGVSEVQA